MHAHGVLVGTTGADDANRLVAKRGVFPFGAVFAHEPRSALLLAWGTGLAVDAFDRGHDEPCRAVLA